MSPEALLRLRAQLNWTQWQCARYVGVDIATWRNWESGSNRPSRKNAETLTFLLNLSKSAEGRAGLRIWSEDVTARRNARRARD
jgi:transcriptional regulator with XRE-family HTH domain